MKFAYSSVKEVWIFSKTAESIACSTFPVWHRGVENRFYARFHCGWRKMPRYVPHCMYSSESLGKGRSWRKKSSLSPPKSECRVSTNLDSGQVNESGTGKKVAIITDRKMNFASMVNTLVKDPLAKARKNDSEVQRVAIDKVEKSWARDTSCNVE